MPEYVCSGAMMRCSMGMAPSNLMVLPANRVMNNNKPQANIMDSKPMVNIMPFGLCRSLANPVVASATSAAMGTLTPMPCIPNTPAPWMPGKTNVMVANVPALNKTCKLACLWAGTIQFNFPGQINVKDAAETPAGSTSGSSLANSSELTTGTGATASAGTVPTIKTETYGTGIVIKGSEEFILKVKCDLKLLEGTKTGKGLIDSINNNKNKNVVTIEEGKTISECECNTSPPNDWSNNNIRNNVGLAATVKFFPKDLKLYPYAAFDFPFFSKNTWAWKKTPSQIILGHELIHANHIVNGKVEGLISKRPIEKITDDPEINVKYNNKLLAIEERRTVGLPKNEKYGLKDESDEEFTENKLRDEFGLPLRTSYLDPGDNLW